MPNQQRPQSLTKQNSLSQIVLNVVGGLLIFGLVSFVTPFVLFILYIKLFPQDLGACDFGVCAILFLPATLTVPVATFIFYFILKKWAGVQRWGAFLGGYLIALLLCGNPPVLQSSLMLFTKTLDSLHSNELNTNQS